MEGVDCLGLGFGCLNLDLYDFLLKEIDFFQGCKCILCYLLFVTFFYLSI